MAGANHECTAIDVLIEPSGPQETYWLAAAPLSLLSFVFGKPIAVAAT